MKNKGRLSLVIRTGAPRNHMATILDKVSAAVKTGYINGNGFVFSPLDDDIYEYEFYYTAMLEED